MPHLDEFLFSQESLNKRFGEIPARFLPRRVGIPETEEDRLARAKRLTFRRRGAEGRLEGIFPSLLTKSPGTVGPQRPPGSSPEFPSGRDLNPGLFFSRGAGARSGRSGRARLQRALDESPFTLSARGFAGGGGAGGLSFAGSAVGGATSRLGPRLSGFSGSGLSGRLRR